VVALSSLVLLSPIILAVAIAVRVKLGAPVIYRQERPGLHGEAFTICKFRSMLDTRDADGQLLPGEQRTTPFSERLRAMSLDELPELWNVVKGEMSLVGPRPLMMSYLPRYTPEQARRHDVRPGITGLAQVSGRNAITWEQKFAKDIEYVDSHDLRMDIRILFRTLAIVLTREGVNHGENVHMTEFMGTEAPQPGSSGDE
jgi:sugar transferase EpsL